MVVRRHVQLENFLLMTAQEIKERGKKSSLLSVVASTCNLISYLFTVSSGKSKVSDSDSGKYRRERERSVEDDVNLFIMTKRGKIKDQ